MPYRLVRTADLFRGTALFLFGLMFVPTAIQWSLDGRTLAQRNPAFWWVPEYVHVWHFGLAFAVLASFAALVGLFSRRIGRLRGKDGRLGSELIGWGYAAAMSSPVIVAVMAILGGINGGGLPWVPAAIFYSVLSMAIYLVSEWPNPTAVPEPPAHVEAE